MNGHLKKPLQKAKRKIQSERLIKGFAYLCAYLLIALLLSTYVLSKQNFSADALFWCRLFVGAGFLLILWKSIVGPVVKPPSFTRIARFLEERNPKLNDRLATAVDVSTSRDVHPDIKALIQRDAFKKLISLPQPSFYWPRISWSSIAGAILIVFVFGILFLGGPTEFRYTLGRFLGNWADESDGRLYQIAVTPGSVVIGARADLEIRASLIGFESQQVELNAKYENHPQWETSRMVPRFDSGDFTYLLFDIREPIEYFVESDGIRSETFRIDVSEFPRVTSLKAVLKYPSYSNLTEVTLENEPIISALIGTEVQLQIESDQPSAEGVVKFESGTELPLKADGSKNFSAAFKISKDDYFRIHLANSEGVLNPASDEYIVEGLEDNPPIINFNHPGRDKKVTNIEEVFTELRVEDDHGVAKVSLNYSINGGPDQSIPLSFPRGIKNLTTSHTLYLEEMDLQPGDFVSYFGLASDAITSETTDIFFLEVEPFDLEYYQSQTAPGAGAAGQQSGLELAKQQKQVVVATFALIRDRAKYSEEEIKKNSQTIALIQQRLASQVQVIIERIERRGAASADPRFHKMIEYMNKALEHMGPAEAALNEVKLKDALPEEQKALQQLLRSEALFNEMQVSMAQNSGQGGASPEDLADLVDLELDRTKNQYETLQQSQQRQQDQALDEAAEKLKELAERQQQQLERQRKAQASSSSGGQPSQQELIEQAEELARQLARLSRQQQNEQLNRISRELNRAAREMRNSSQSGQNQQQSLQQAEQAMQRLKEAQKALAQHQQSQIREEFQKLREQAQQLNRNQEEVVERLSQLEQQSTGENLSEEFYQELRRLFWDKEDLQNDLQELEGNLHQSAKRLQGEEPEASRKLKEAGLAVRDNRLPEKMQEGSELLASGLINMARNREETVKEDFQQLTEKIREAEQALGAPGTETEQEKLRKALNEAGRLVEQLEALKQMAEAQQQEGQQRQQGQSGQQEGDQQSQQQGNQRGQQGQGQREGEQQEDSQRGQRTDSAESGQQQGGSQQQDGSDPSQSRQPGQRSQRGGQQNPQNARSAGGVSSSGIDPQRLNREWQERLREAAELPEMLRGNPELSQQASRLFRQMRQFDPSQIFDDQEEIVRLKAAVIDGLHQLELEISKALKDDSEGYLRPVNEDQVPPEFRTRVEDYYRRLAERQKP